MNKYVLTITNEFGPCSTIFPGLKEAVENARSTFRGLRGCGFKPDDMWNVPGGQKTLEELLDDLLAKGDGESLWAICSRYDACEVIITPGREG